MATTMTTAAKNAAIKANVIETLLSNLPEGSVQVGEAEFAIPTMVDGELRYAEIKVTAKNNKATKVSPAYDPEAKRAEWLEILAERDLKAKEKAAAKEKAKSIAKKVSKEVEVKVAE